VVPFFNYRRFMRKALFLVLLFTFPLFAQEKVQPKADKLVVTLTEDQQAKLDSLLMQYETLKVQMENVQLKYSLRIREFKESLKLGPEYTWDDQSKRFLLSEKK
jgi:hypothetical protein